MDKRIFAYYKNPIIKVILEQKFKFDTLEEARQKITSIKEYFVSYNKNKEDDRDSVLLWIRDFNVTTKLRQQGYKGNFGKISIVQVKEKYILSLEDVDLPLEEHHKDKIPAYDRHPKIRAILAKLYKFDSLKEARQKLYTLKEEFVSSSKYDEENPEDRLTLWIRDFNVSQELIQQGYKGNFGKISIVELRDKYVFKLEKIDIPLKNHPQRKREKQKHPDWGYYILRSYVKKQIGIPILEDARELLSSLYKDYPQVTIKATEDRLYTEVYSKEHDPPFERIIIWIDKDDSSDLFYLRYSENYSSTRWLDTKVYEHHDSVFIYAFGEKSIVDQSVTSLAIENN